MKLKNNKQNIWQIILFISIILYSLIFFLTGNPYSAFHSGKTGYASNYRSSSFIFNPSVVLLIILLFTFLFYWIKYRKVFVSKIAITFLFLMLFSTCLNKGVILETSTVIYNVISILLASSLALYQIKFYDCSNINNIKRTMHLILLLLIFGLILAYIQPNRYGLINLDFSRELRGEITYWLVLGLQIWGVVLSLTLFCTSHKKIYILVICFILFFQLAFANRMAIISLGFPIMIYFLFIEKSSTKLIFLIFGLFIVVLYWDEILSIFMIGNNSDIDTILNGRLPLWTYYIDQAVRNWYCGGGVNLSTSIEYTGNAVSEIGVLKWFGEYGIFVGSLQLYLIIKAIKKGIIIIKYELKKERKKINYTSLVLCFYYISCFVPFLLESHSRILNTTDFFAWFSMYYIINKKIGEKYSE